ncbi:MAG: EpsG family protein [Prevotella sp.]|uniref:EpsG family protein n=1 Tax=Prevotella sp. TaxID=59823 RepID=UPI0025851D4F|nr:EpsG family protein [Prevotella sp.]MDD6853747.1 EpsG family protein [Prevotella sp.]
MLLYYTIFFIAIAIYYSSVGNGIKTDNQRYALVAMLTFLALFVGVADMLGGYDRYIYAELFDDTADMVSDGIYDFRLSPVADLYPKEYGYQIYNVLVGAITDNRYIFIFITTCVIYVLLYHSIKDYCNNYPFAVILFLGLWFFFSFTYLRQVMGATIAWLSVRYIIQRDWKRFLLVWFIAWSFHNSALILLPMYFVPVRKFEKKKVIYVMLAALLLGLTGGPSAIFSAYGEVDSERVETVSNETGFRIAYLVEAAFFLYIILKRYDEIPLRRANIVLMNMALVFCLILLFFIKNENGGRLSWYYMIGIISTITYLCTYTHHNRKFANVIVVVCFFLFNRILTNWGGMLYPYKTFFTDGFRKDDEIEIQYEYDHNYDRDKMYRRPFKFGEERR